MDTTVKVPCTISACKNIRGRITGYKASLGQQEANGTKAPEAKAALATSLAAIAAENLTPVIWWSLDRTEVWVCYRDHYGWYYTIQRPADGRVLGGLTPPHWHHGSQTPSVSWGPTPPHWHHGSQGGTCGCYPTREACLDAMTKHWYDNNIHLIVLGIAGLAGYRAFNCPKCSSAVYSYPIREHVYQCQNPACGHETVEGVKPC